MTGNDATTSTYRQGTMRPVERRLNAVKRKIAFRNWQRWDVNTGIRTASFLALVLLFWSTTFIGVYRLCNALVMQPILGPVFLQRIFTFGFLSVFTLSFLSHILTAYSSLFTQSELLILHAAPIHPATLFRVQARDALIRGSWMIGLICLPILMAYGYSLHAYRGYYPLAIAGLIPFLLIGGSLGVTVTVIVMPYFAGRAKRMQFFEYGFSRFADYRYLGCYAETHGLFGSAQPRRIFKALGEYHNITKRLYALPMALGTHGCGCVVAASAISCCIPFCCGVRLGSAWFLQIGWASVFMFPAG